MATITTRKLDQATYYKAEQFLRKAGTPLEQPNIFFYQLSVQNGTDEGLILDACVALQDKKIAIKYIWVMEYNSRYGIVSARNDRGERGSYAKMLGEKYVNRFLEHLATVDINNAEERQILLLEGNEVFTLIGSKGVMDQGNSIYFLKRKSIK